MISNVVKELMGTSKPKEKIEILKKYDELYQLNFKNFLFLSYDPFVQHNVKLSMRELPWQSGDKEIMDIIEEVYEAIDFCRNSLSSKQNREKLFPVFAKINKQEQEFLFKVINKNWKVGISKKTVLKAFPGLIATFDVQLANTYKKDKHNVIDRVWTYKLDGLRSVALRKDDGWHFYSRTGKEFWTVDHIKPWLERFYELDRSHPTFWDGELYKHGLKFEDIQGLVMGFKQGTAEELEFHTFVNGPAESFLDQTNKGIYSHGPWRDNDSPVPIKYAQGGVIEKEKDVDAALEQAFEMGYEGIMMRDMDKEYDFKRSNALLKYKELEDDEQSMEIISDCVVLDMEIDEFPVVEDGAMRYEDMLVTLIVEQEDGIECRMGAGCDLDVRRYYRDHPEEILGKTVEVKHQRWGNKGRMRFPRLIRIREDL
jgi:ATP-dependent DNA ligase